MIFFCCYMTLPLLKMRLWRSCFHRIHTSWTNSCEGWSAWLRFTEATTVLQYLGYLMEINQDYCYTNSQLSFIVRSNLITIGSYSSWIQRYSWRVYVCFVTNSTEEAWFVLAVLAYLQGRSLHHKAEGIFSNTVALLIVLKCSLESDMSPSLCWNILSGLGIKYAVNPCLWYVYSTDLLLTYYVLSIKVFQWPAEAWCLFLTQPTARSS